METNCIINIIDNETSTFQNRSEDCPEVVLLDFEDKSLGVINSSSKWVWLLIASLIGCVGINLAGKILIMWYVNYHSIPRPMNVMIQIDQGLQIVPVMVHGTATIGNLIMKKPLVNYFGHTGCRLWHFFSLIKNTSLVVGGAGMACYRMSIYKFAHRISDCEAIRKVILWIELIVFLALLSHFAYIPSLTNNVTSVDDFCKGYTFEMSLLIQSISIGKESVAFGMKMNSFGILFAQIILLLELFCYITLFYWKKRDNHFESNKNFAHRRICQNTITLTGQTLSFAMETTYVILITFLKTSTDLEFLDHSYITIYANFIWCLVTLTHICTSPDMMRSLL